jgi:hypothetical protein
MCAYRSRTLRVQQGGANMSFEVVFTLCMVFLGALAFYDLKIKKNK